MTGVRLRERAREDSAEAVMFVLRPEQGDVGAFLSVLLFLFL